MVLSAGIGVLSAPAFADDGPAVRAVPVSVAPTKSGSKRPKEASEYQLRAAMVVGIVRYTNWQKDFGDTLNICLIGESKSFEHIRVLENNNKLVKMKTVRVSHISKPTKAKIAGCQVLVAGSNAPRELISLQSDSPSFLICDQCNGLSKNASVTLHKVQDRIRFDVHLGNAKESGVQFSSSMLSIAHRVEGMDG